MNRLEKAKEIIAKNHKSGRCGIYDTDSLTGDSMEILYDEDSLTIKICYRYEYFEVFGLMWDEFMELEKFYESLG